MKAFRVRNNADGTSTVFKFHEGQANNSFNVNASMMSSASLPPEVILGGRTASRYQQQYSHPVSPTMSAPMHTSVPSNNMMYSTHNMQQPQAQTPVVIVKPSKRRKNDGCAKKCYRSNNPLCITCGVFLSISIIIGYVCLIMLLIPGSTKNRWGEHDSLSSRANNNIALTDANGVSGSLKQQSLRSSAVGNTSSSILTSSSSSASINDGIPKGQSYNAIVTILDLVDDEPHPTVVQSPDELQRKVTNYNIRVDEDEPIRRG